MLATEEGERLWNYWSQELSGEPPALTLPTVGSRPPVQTYRGTSHTFRLGHEVVSQLRSFTQAEGGTLFMTLLAAFQILLYRYTGQQDILVGSPVAVRNRVELERVVGYLINPVVLRAHLSGHLTFKKVFGQVRQTVLAALEHHAYPLSLLIDRLQPARDASRSPLFQVMFIWDKPRQPKEQPRTQVSQTQPMPAAHESQFQSDFFSSAQRGAALDLILTVFEVGDSLSASLQYNVDLFDVPTIARMANHFRTLLESVGANPDRRISELPLLTGAERYQMFREWNDTQKDYPNDDCIHQLFEAQAKISPDSVALSFDGESLTYRQLNERANQLANFLRNLGVGPEVLIGICLDRSTDLVVGLLGILKAGGAYVPLDPAFPKERLAFMLRSARVPVLLTQHTLLADLPEYEGQVLCLDTDWPLIAREGQANPATELVPDNLAYVIYTSGSTGGPKGVQISHRAVVNFLSSMAVQPGIATQDILFAVTSPSFDIAALELLLPLTVGAQVLIAESDVVFDGIKLAESLETSEASIMQATPATWRLLLRARWPGKKNLKILSGGEALSRKLADQLLERGSSLWNLYGPTETTIWSTALKVVGGAVSIGHPIANTQVYLLDPNLQPVPVGVRGELHIGGIGLARGYLNHPELTAMKFVPDPSGQERGGRLYKTGDLARYSTDGNIEFLNRIDSQVKVRGFRIELEEVEAVLNLHPGVQDVVVVRSEDSGEGRLVAYVVAHDSTSRVGAQQIQIGKEHKFATLPNGMVIAHHGGLQSSLLYKEVFEDEVYWRHNITLNAGDCIFDVGANIGLFALYISQKCEDAKIYAFEPLPPNFELLELNVALNRLNVHLFNVGLSAATETASFTFYPHLAALSVRFPEGDKQLTKSVVRSWLQKQASEHRLAGTELDLDALLEYYLQSQSYTCQLRTLSDIIRDNNIERIDLLKIDVEKSEAEVVSGILDDDLGKIRQVILEVHSKSAVDLITARLERKGFDVAVDDGIVVEEGVEYVYTLFALRRSPRTDIMQEKPDKNSYRARPVSPEPQLSISHLRSFLKEKLPDYMVPSTFVMLDALPLTPNGKVDRKALPAPSLTRPALAAKFVAPRTPLEETLAGIWVEVLSVERVGIHDNFFELGGASIQALEIVVKAEKRGLHFAPELLFEYQTIAELADAATAVSTSESV